MATLILVKHSMPEVDPTIPASQWRLSAHGKTRCTWLAHELARSSVAVLRSSDELKARQTAEIVGSILGIAPRCVEGLQENDRTDFPYLHDTNAFEQRIRDFFDNPDQLRIGRETAHEALKRFRAAVYKIVDAHPEKTVCVVAHGTVISLFAAHYNDVGAFEIWKSLNPLPAYLILTPPHFQTAGPAVGFRE